MRNPLGMGHMALPPLHGPSRLLSRQATHPFLTIEDSGSPSVPSRAPMDCRAFAGEGAASAPRPDFQAALR
jgi:hypothetical protein